MRPAGRQAVAHWRGIWEDSPTVFSQSGPALRPAIAIAGLLLLGTIGALAQTAPVAADRAAAEAAIARGRQFRSHQNALDARPQFLEAIAIAQKLNDKPLLQQAYDGMAEVAGDLSDWAGMLDYAQKMYDVMPDPTGPQRASYLSKRGRVMQELRERDQAMAAYEEALALAEASHDRRRVAQLHNEIGLATWRFDRDFDKAIKYYDDGIAMAEALGDWRMALVIYSNSGNLFRRPGKYPEAERRYRAAMAAGKKAGIDDDAFVLKNLGIVLRETGRREEAERMLQRAVAVADRNGQSRIQWQGRMELGTFYGASDMAKASEQYEGALASLEGLNNNVLLEGFLAGALSGAVTIYDDPYDLYTDLLLGNGRAREAFVVAERARARAFLDTLSLARDEIAQALPPAFVAEERTLLQRISTNQGAIRQPGIDADARRSLQQAIAADEEALGRIRIRLATEHPSIAHARYPRIAATEEVQSRILRPGEVLLQYYLGASHGTLWIVTPQRVEVRRLPPRAEIERDVRAYLDTLSTPDGDFRAAAASLATVLLPDLEPVIAGQAPLVVVPHGVLTYLPFETLMPRGDRFLVEDHAVSYAPSTSSLAFLRERQASGTEVLAIGNPIMRGSGTDAERGQAIDRVGYLKPLEFSGPEVRAVSAVFGSTARVFEQEAATEEVLSAPEASRAGIVHIATHGLVDEEMPDRSGLALTAAPPQSDGILQMREVYKLRLNAALVTLSACQTALGKAVNGEGMIGLSRAFFYAGSNAVLASLWNVNDASTARLMAPFYESLAGGESIDEALRAAKLVMVKEGGRLSHPYFWAAFVVSGNGSGPMSASVPRAR